MTQVDIAVRTEILDEATGKFLNAHPAATVVNLGAGLEDRFGRLDNGRVRWFDLDLPEVVDLRRRFFEEEPRRRFLPKSILDFSWLDDVGHPAGEPIWLIAEGVLHYFQEPDVRQLFDRIATRWPGAEMVFHSTSPLCLHHQPHSATFRDFAARFRWGIRSGREIEAWDPRYELLAEWAFVDRHPARWRWVRYARWLPWLGGQLRSAMKISHVRFRAAPRPAASRPS